jgi:hypothetical protein
MQPTTTTIHRPTRPLRTARLRLGTALLTLSAAACSPPSQDSIADGASAQMVQAPRANQDAGRAPQSVVYINAETGLPREPTEEELAAAAAVFTTQSTTSTPVEVVLPDGAAAVDLKLEFSSVQCITPDGTVLADDKCAAERVQP